MGADQVVDFRRQDFTRLGPFDLILDLVAHRSVFAYRRALAPGGPYRCVGGSVRALLRVLTVGVIIGRPVHFVVGGSGETDPERDASALGRLRRAAAAAGFDDVAFGPARIGCGP